MSKLEVYFNEYNIPTDNTIYFPYSSGLLRAYVQQFTEVTDYFEFMPFLFLREPTEDILSHYNNPSIACFSSSLWNHRLNLKIAKMVKEKFPKCLIVFGGPQVTLGDKLYKEYPFIDIGVFGEGERMFKQILLQHLEGRAFKQTTIREDAPVENLDSYPSPYTTGLFTYMIENNPQIEFKAIMETNRSCPFKCSFCFYGQSDLNKKITHHGFEYIRDEAIWFAKNKIKYVFCADANFGMYKRDVTIAQIYADVKTANEFPEKFRVCYGKNATDTIFQTAKILSGSNLSKTVTLALQSNDAQVLKNIGRTNIKRETFVSLQKKYTEANIPTYTEIILGLPGETVETFLEGLEFVLQSSYNNQLFIYHCQILPNTEMAEENYLAKYGIKTVKVPLAEVHGSVRDNSIEQEYEQVVISSNSLNEEQWRYCVVLAWIIQLFYSLKVGDILVRFLHEKYSISYTDYFKHILDSNLKEVITFKQHAIEVQKGKPRCQYDLRFSPIYYEPEELAFLNLNLNKDVFYNELLDITLDFLNKRGIVYSLKEVKEIFAQQISSLPEPKKFTSTEEYARKVVLHGRKSNKMNPIGFQLT